ncbi:Putative ribonuclease H protein At1g65750 [Linum perenne]
MRLEWDKGIRRLCIQTDSKALVLLFKDGANLDHRLASHVEQFHSYKSRDIEVLIRHIYREANNVADYLANLGHLLDIGCHVFLYLDSKLLYWLGYDRTGVCLPRDINNTS